MKIIVIGNSGRARNVKNVHMKLGNCFRPVVPLNSSYLESLQHSHTCSDLPHPDTCHCSDRVARHTRWCPNHSGSLEIPAHRNTGMHWPCLYRWLHSGTARTGTRLCPPHRLSPGTLQHTGTGAQSQGCPCRCPHSGMFPPNIRSHYPGIVHLQIQLDSGRNSHWLHQHSRTYYRCRGYSDIHRHLGCSWALWSHLGSGSCTRQLQVCLCSWCKLRRGRRHTAHHSFYL